LYINFYFCRLLIFSSWIITRNRQVNWLSLMILIFHVKIPTTKHTILFYSVTVKESCMVNILSKLYNFVANSVFSFSYIKVSLNELFWWQQQALAFNGPLWKVVITRMWELGAQIHNSCDIVLKAQLDVRLTSENFILPTTSSYSSRNFNFIFNLYVQHQKGEDGLD